MYGDKLCALVWGSRLQLILIFERSIVAYVLACSQMCCSCNEQQDKLTKLPVQQDGDCGK